MPDLVLIAFIGLLLLAPLEILLLIILALIKQKPRFPEPVLKVPDVKAPARYGWEDYLKLPSGKKPSSKQSQVVIAAIIAVIGLLIIGPAYLFFPSISAFSNATAAVNDTPAVNATAAAVNITSESAPAAMPEFLNLFNFSNISVLHAFEFPSLSFIEDRVSSYTRYIAIAVLVIAFLVVCLAAFLLFLRSKRNAVLRRAKKTAERLIRKDAPFISISEKLRPYFFPIAALLLLGIIAFVIYFLRGFIRAEFAPWIYGTFASVGNFLMLYRFYLLAGIALLVVVVAALRVLSASRKKQ